MVQILKFGELPTKPPLENIYNLFDVSARISSFTSSIEFIGTDLLKEQSGSGSCSSGSFVIDSSFTGTCLKYCQIDFTILT